MNELIYLKVEKAKVWERAKAALRTLSEIQGHYALTGLPQVSRQMESRQFDILDQRIESFIAAIEKDGI